MEPYTEQLYKHFQNNSRDAAKEIVAILGQYIQPKSIIDVGCGTGTWLSVFQQLGIEDFLGVDGKWVEKKMLEIPPEKFQAVDLEKPLQIDRQFDLVVSLEVAEHLPPECAQSFVDSLVKLGSVIMFSAAVPFQGGTNHINEQWQDYWVKRFQARGYVPIDCLRKKIWQNDKVTWYYAQNILLFVEKEYLKNNELLQKEAEKTEESQLAIVHPYLYMRTASEAKKFKQELEAALALKDARISLKKILLSLPTMIADRLSKKISQKFYKQ